MPESADQENEFPLEYEAALRGYLTRGDEEFLELAFQFGRAAIAPNRSLLKVIDHHQDIVLEMVLGLTAQDEAKRLAQRGNEFLRQVLVAAEMVARAMPRPTRNCSN